jgi:putative nucleotidyltransferase with HDIG domain
MTIELSLILAGDEDDRRDLERLPARADAREAYTAGHARRVRLIALEIADELALPAEQRATLSRAALFHDIGKLAVPEEILLKPSTLTEEEWELMRRHSDEGARMLETVGAFHDAVPGVRHHHERFDGTGYPHGLAGEAIPLVARIVHLADALDSMLTTRIYRTRRSPKEALAEVRHGSGSQFCPHCVAALERLVDGGKLAALGLRARTLARMQPSG